MMNNTTITLSPDNLCHAECIDNIIKVTDSLGDYINIDPSECERLAEYLIEFI